MEVTEKFGWLRQAVVARAACGLLWLTALGLAAWAWQLRAQLSVATATLGASTSTSTSTSANTTHTQATTGDINAARAIAEQDFTHRLPAASQLTTRAHTLIESSQRAAAARGVQWLAVTSTPLPSNERSLAKLDVSLTLQGSYPQVKAVLADALSRTPPVVFKQLELRRAVKGGDVEAQLSLMLIGRPALGDAR